ncbi:hypothetical protein MSAN_02467800 [Mycena sanguinolenta]|uniref:Cyanovirin-N domain-containing protein n=1 Tax=Mycena sanguinolenta TaxID=230812 RepID=A0A8H6U483_9AGAR|nr:hypothetical protein MSAN_02467800 [Mycena sanguinolenta]
MFTKYLLPVLAAAAMVAAGALTCNEWQIFPNTEELIANCVEDSGQFKNTGASISDCVGNGNGFPGCQVNGGAAASCVMSDLVATPTVVTVTMSCKADDGSTRVTTGFDVGNCFSNQNGVLAC